MTEGPPPDPSPPSLPVPPAPNPPPPFPRGCLAALLVVAGTLLLLPGLCTESFWHIELHKPNVPLSRPAVIIFAIEFAGAALILAGIVTAIVWLAPRQRSVFAKAFLVLASLIVALFGLTLILTVVMR